MPNESFEKNYFLSNIPKNHSNIYKTPHNIDSCDEHRVLDCLKDELFKNILGVIDIKLIYPKESTNSRSVPER